MAIEFKTTAVRIRREAWEDANFREMWAAKVHEYFERYLTEAFSYPEATEVDTVFTFNVKGD